MLETMLRALRGLLRFWLWFGSDPPLAQTIVDEQLERTENRRWGRAFLELHRRKSAQASPRLGRPGSRRQP